LWRICEIASAQVSLPSWQIFRSDLFLSGQNRSWCKDSPHLHEVKSFPVKGWLAACFEIEKQPLAGAAARYC